MNDWPDKEISTRNCYHGKVHPGEVICKFKGYRWDIAKVLASNELLHGCKNCAHRDCEWEV